MVRTLPTVCMVLVFTGWQAQQTNSVVVTAAMEAAETASKVYDTVQKVRQFLKPDSTADDQLTENDLRVFDKLDNIADRLEKFENRLFSALSQNFDDKFTKRTEDFYQTIDYVDSLYKKFLLYCKNLTLSKNPMQELFEKAFGLGFNEITHRIERMHNTLTSKNGVRENLLDIISNQKEPKLMCQRQQSIQQIIWQMYQAVVINDLQVFALKLMSLQFKYNDTLEFQHNAELQLTEFKERNQNTYNTVIRYLPSASRDVWKCDPPQNIKDYSYSKLQEIFQALITNEQDTVYNTCDIRFCHQLNDLNDKNPYAYEPHSDFAKKLPEKLRCSGRLTNCMSTAAELKYCVAADKDDRRYEGMKTTKTYGQYDDSCPRNRYAEYEMAFIHKCSLCLCTCLSNKLDVDRYFSLEPAVSSVDKNMVVTGVRLRKENHVFYMEIQEGYLGEYGTIEGRLNWVKVGYNKSLNMEKIWRDKNGDANPLKNEEVYSVHWNQRTVYLDDITYGKPGLDFVLTGLQFKQLKDALFLQIRLSIFDYKTGKILLEGEWYNNTASEERRRINLDKSDDPLKHESHIIDSTSGQYLKFQTTDYESNMGQFTVPFLDMQEVVTNPPVPFAGAGLYHKGETNGKSGGFLGLKLIQYDISKHYR